MAEEAKKTLGEYIYGDVEQNERLKEIYGAILSNYVKVLLQTKEPLKQISIHEALNYIAFLSKSKGAKNSEKHRQLAQEMIALFHYLYPDDQEITYFMGTILTNIGNFPGLSLQAKGYQSRDPMDRIFDKFSAEHFAIPNTQGATFNLSQKQIYDRLSKETISYSGPTSMGKSFLVRVYIKDQVLKGSEKNFAIVVTTKALINEISAEVIDSLKDSLTEKNYRVVSSLNAIALEQKHHFIFAMTPERLLYLLIQNPKLRIDFAFIDEAHKISEEDERSAFYFKVVDLLVKRGNTRFVFASPNIPNPEVYLSLVNPSLSKEERQKNAKVTQQSPVNQMKFMIDLRSHRFKTYDDFQDAFTSTKALPSSDDFISIVKRITRFDDPDKATQSLVYCSSKDRAIQMAEEFAQTLPYRNDPALDSFSNKIADEINADYFLVDLVRKGVAFHVGYLPSSLRMSLEELFKKGKIRIIFCTSTLLEGVNLPADNLFVTSYRNNGEMTAIEFKNLTGRVGRIKFNLFGNVFLVIDSYSKNDAEAKFTKLISEKPGHETLSIDKALRPKVCKTIVAHLKDGDASLDKSDFAKSFSNERYYLVRKCSSILLRDVTSDQDSLVKEMFVKNGLNSQDVQLIKQKFSNRISLTSDDINTSLDQDESLAKAISSAKGALCYPPMNSNGHFDYGQVVDFLNKIADIFYWDKYEWNLVGKNNRNSLKHYAVLLTQWMSGYGIGFMTASDIDYRTRTPGTQIRIYGKNYPFDSTSLVHKNAAIAQTLEAIQNVLLFKFSKYFLKFSTEYKKQFGQDSLAGKDWYEFVEFGSSNVISITLQRNGYSREAAIYLQRNASKYLTVVSGKLKVRETILKCPNEEVKQESQDIYYNSKELFTL